MYTSALGSAEPCTDIWETLKFVCEMLSVNVKVNVPEFKSKLY